MEIVTELKKQCPACGEEILTTAKKCKHCGEWIEKKPSDTENPKIKKKEEESMGFGIRVFLFLIAAAVGWALFYFGSWSLIFGEKISIMAQYLIYGELKAQNFILEVYGFLFRINESYYGFAMNGEFFDSPVIQWIMLILAFCIFGGGLKVLIFGMKDND